MLWGEGNPGRKSNQAVVASEGALQGAGWLVSLTPGRHFLACSTPQPFLGRPSRAPSHPQP